MKYWIESWVGVGISSRYRFFGLPVHKFSSEFGICCRFSKYRDIGSVFFGISLCVKAPPADPKILLLIRILTEYSCSRTAAAGRS